MIKSILKRCLFTIPFVERTASALRARQQERFARSYRRFYEQEAAIRATRVLKGEDLRRALERRIGQRRLGRPQKNAGDLHLFLAYSAKDWEWILPRALSPFGRVTEYDWKSHGYDAFAPGWLHRRDLMNREMLEAFHAANREYPVDAVIGYVTGLDTSSSVLQEMASAGAAIFNFSYDDTLNFPGQMIGGRFSGIAAVAPAIDLNLTSTPWCQVKYAAIDALSDFFPCAAHPDVHRPYEIPFEFDVSFVGARYGPRGRFIDRLRQLGLPIAAFGHGWPRGHLTPEEMIRLYSRTRVNLGFSGIGHSDRLLGLKGRDFEVPMSGGLYLTQDNPELSLVYDVGEEIVTYTSVDDCASRIRSLLADRDRSAAIRSAGRRRALRDHTYHARWTRVFEMAGLLAAAKDVERPR